MNESVCSQVFAFMDPSSKQEHESPDIVIAVAEKVKVKKTITYIVCGVILRKINGNHEVLMIQEARPDCNGVWYLPAGRMEPGETIEEGMMREVVEETGILCKSDGLLSVETAEQSRWFRFTFLASEIGGKLKTTADKESLQAQWYPVADVLNKTLSLRGTDILKLIQIGLERYTNGEKKLAVAVDRPISKLLCRICFAHSFNNRTSILVRKVGNVYKFPIVEFSQSIWFGVCANTMSQLFVGKVWVNISACLSLESYTKPAYEHDGFLITLLCNADSNSESLNLNEQALKSGYSLEPCENAVVLNNINLWTKYGCKFF